MISIDPHYQQLSHSLGWGDPKSAIDATKARILRDFVIGPKVLDIGCATGIYTQLLTSLGHQVTGLDHNQNLLKHAKARVKKATFIHSPFPTNKLQASSFDTLVAFDILEHLDDSQSLTQIHRLTKQRLILSVPHTTDPLLADLFLLYGHHIDPTHQRTYTPDSLTNTLSKHHFNLIHLEPSHPISTDALFLNLLEGQPLLKRLARKLSFTLTKPKMYYTNLIAIADIA